LNKTISSLQNLGFEDHPYRGSIVCPLHAQNIAEQRDYSRIRLGQRQLPMTMKSRSWNFELSIHLGLPSCEGEYGGPAGEYGRWEGRGDHHLTQIGVIHCAGPSEGHGQSRSLFFSFSLILSSSGGCKKWFSGARIPLKNL